MHNKTTTTMQLAHKNNFPMPMKSQNMLVNNHSYNYKKLGKSILPI